MDAEAKASVAIFHPEAIDSLEVSAGEVEQVVTCYIEPMLFCDRL
ncbi:MAG: hypothetical protein WBA10_09325 [Elainellaceae cyanobacterium]